MSSEEQRWAPSCSLQQLRARARLLQDIRAFFGDRGVMEVETPLLGRHTVTDPHLIPFEVPLHGRCGEPARFLQTSPEFAMKRLLAAGSGSIYQICKAFRDHELGRWHNPEFTLLEWYRTGFSLHDLIDEVEALLGRLLAGRRTLAGAERLRYAALFEHHVGANPFSADLIEFDHCARALGFPEARQVCGSERATWLDFLFSHSVQPHLGDGRLSFVEDFPACLPSLARRNPADPNLTERVEVFLDGVELANGFHELADADEQERRFTADQQSLQHLGLPPRRADQRLLAALAAGLPDCSGIAMGLDRLLMLMTGATEIQEVLSFPFAEA